MISTTRRKPLAIVLALSVLASTNSTPAQESPVRGDEPVFLRGDANLDGSFDIADPTSVLGCLFLGAACSECPDAADSNDDGGVDLSDAAYSLGYLFLGGPPPARPGPDVCGPDPTTDRLPACRYPTTLCGDPEPEPEEDPTLADTHSRLQYASVAEAAPMMELPDEQGHRIIGRFTRREVPYQPRPDARYPWNSSAARRYLSVEVGDFEHDEEGAHSHARGSLEAQILTHADGPPCVEADYYVEAGDRQFGGWPGIKFQAPANAFGTQADARAFLLQVQAEQPFYLPYRDSSVKLGHGWYYNSGGLHRACDYSRTGVEEDEDPTFLVRSAGSGEVVAVTWDHNAGNTVAVEHTAPGGQKVMFIYLHLRNGRANDVANALSSTSNSDKYVKYRAFAANYPNHLSWGEDDQTIEVSVGQHVSAGQIIGYAGNTGAGGAGAGLNDDGDPDNWEGNVHLHVYVAAPHPTVNDTWVWVDPYGVYNEVETGCYDLLKDTSFSRLYAPFYPHFHGVPFEVFRYYFGYFPNMGRELKTISVHRKGEKLLCSGSFQTNIPGGWYVHGYMTGDQFQDKFDQYWAIGYVPREMSVEKTLGGSPRYTAIWKPLKPGESIVRRRALPTSDWVDLWDDKVVDDEWRLEDYFGYSVGNTNYHSVLVTSNEGRPFAFSGLQSSASLDQLVDDFSDDGLLPVNFNVAEMTYGRRYTGVFRSVPGCWKVYWGRTPSQYQDLFSDKLSKGYKLWKIQGYADSSRYGVIFTKDSGPCN
jgi:hypothetical protein